MTGFEIGKRYKTRDGFVTAELIATGPTRLVFGDIADSDELYVRNLKGCYNNVTESRDDFLPLEVREPRRVEGVVYVNEYDGHKRSDTGYVLGDLFGFDAGMYASRQVAEKYATSKATRVAVKYKVTFEEVTE
jgi:hypothetical protein